MRVGWTVVIYLPLRLIAEFFFHSVYCILAAHNVVHIEEEKRGMNNGTQVHGAIYNADRLVEKRWQSNAFQSADWRSLRLIVTVKTTILGRC